MEYFRSLYAILLKSECNSERNFPAPFLARTRNFMLAKKKVLITYTNNLAVWFGEDENLQLVRGADDKCVNTWRVGGVERRLHSRKLSQMIGSDLIPGDIYLLDQQFHC